MDQSIARNTRPPSAPKLVNIYWLVGAALTLLLITASTVGSTWPRLHSEMTDQVSLISYSGSIAVSYLSWIGIAILINYLQRAVPMFSRQHSYWWLIHGGLGFSIGALHLLGDTLLLWAALQQSFSLQAAYVEKLLRWLPYEVLAYWACLSVFTAISKHNISFGSNKNQAQYPSRLPIKVEGETELLEVAGIEWIESCDNYVVAWRKQESFMFKDTMNNLESILDPTVFLRLHRSVIVNVNEVKKIRKMENGSSVVELKNGKRLPVSRRRQRSINLSLKSGSARAA